MTDSRHTQYCCSARSPSSHSSSSSPSSPSCSPRSSSKANHCDLPRHRVDRLFPRASSCKRDGTRRGPSFMTPVNLLFIFAVSLLLTIPITYPLYYPYIHGGGLNGGGRLNSDSKNDNGPFSQFLYRVWSRYMSSARSEQQEQQQLANDPPLRFITLSFNTSASERPMLEHNCALFLRTNSPHERYEIHTDDLSQPICRHCACVKFEPTNCACPIPSERGNCMLCEKLEFLIRMIEGRSGSQSRQTAGSNDEANRTKTNEFVFLDSDLLVMHPRFGERLRARAQHFDFLAAYGRWHAPCLTRHTTDFNSGLMFMRRVAGVDYARLRHMMHAMRRNNDQSVISPFVRKWYRGRWDSLSLRWHCRYLWKAENNIEPQDCLAFHDRGRATAKFLQRSNRSLLRLEEVRSGQVPGWLTALESEN